jgi:UDP-N-acetylmuramoyl-tripeptide--D-alanyl-D-alanine ligase
VSAVQAIAAVAALGSIAVGVYRWVRVAQREHYIAGACWATGWRWALRRPPNFVLGVAVAVAIVAAIVLRALDQITAMSIAASVAAVLNALFPWPMPIRGTPPLRFTRRANTLTAITVLLLVTIVAAIGLLWSWVIGLVAAACATPVAVDVAMAGAAPLERRALERHRRRAEVRLRHVAPFVIAVTGSWGKTSTKNHIRDLVTGSAETVASPASWNNTAGLSRTINEHLTDTTEVLVAEMGTYGPGEIRDMCAWLRPRVGIICAIGPMHLERMRTIETVVAAKAEIFEGVETAIVWADDPRLAALADTLVGSQVVRVGTRGTGPLDVEVEQGDGQLRVWVDGEIVGSAPADGGPHPGNLGCAVAAAMAYGVAPSEIAARIGSLSMPDHRATVGMSDAGMVVIDDTFNSNPAGARAALHRLTDAVSGRRVVVTPGMVELGPIQNDENESFARAVAEAGATLVVVGWTNRRALVAGGPTDTLVVTDREQARQWVRDHLGQGDGVLWENDVPDHYP